MGAGHDECARPSTGPSKRHTRQRPSHMAELRRPIGSGRSWMARSYSNEEQVCHARASSFRPGRFVEMATSCARHTACARRYVTRNLEWLHALQCWPPLILPACKVSATHTSSSCFLCCCGYRLLACLSCPARLAPCILFPVFLSFCRWFVFRGPTSLISLVSLGSFLPCRLTRGDEQLDVTMQCSQGHEQAHGHHVTEFLSDLSYCIYKVSSYS